MNAHRGVVQPPAVDAAGLRPRRAGRVLQKTPFSFDVSVWEFFWPLMTGARLVVARPGGHQEPDYLLRCIIRAGVTTAALRPLHAPGFLEEPGLEQCASLRRVVCSGEALPARAGTSAAWSACPRAQLHNLYGPTEAAVDVTPSHCRREEGRARCPSAGPSPTPRIHVLDAHLRAGARGRAGRAVHRRRAGGPRLPARARSSPPSASSRIPSPPSPARACTAPATWRAGWPTAHSSSWAALTSR